MHLRDLLKDWDCYIPGLNIRDFEVKGIACNSKSVALDYVFVAIRGTRENGEAFIDEAIKKGAKVIVTQDTRHKTQGDVVFIKVKDTRRALGELSAKFYGHPSGKVKVIGVTGTNGKTTITYLLESLLEQAHHSAAVIGTINYRFSGMTIPSLNTTPGSLEIHSLLAEMREKGVQYLAIEVSSHALDQERTTGVKFHSAIFTNLTQDHLDYHRNKRLYFQAKAKLFRALSKDAFAVINQDDTYGRKLASLTKAKKITYGIKQPCDVRATCIKFSSESTEFTLVSSKGKIHIETCLIGKHNVYNILAVCAWALEAGFTLEFIRKAAGNFVSAPGRLERIESSKPFSVFVDYAHTEDALRNVITALKGIVPKRMIVVFGCGGERDRLKRPKMGRVVSTLADYAIITSDNPRGEDPDKIIKDITRGIKRDNYTIIPDRLKAIRKALAMARAGDLVLLAGKGHENYQVVKGKKFIFDDRKVAGQCLN